MTAKNISHREERVLLEPELVKFSEPDREKEQISLGVLLFILKCLVLEDQNGKGLSIRDYKNYFGVARHIICFSLYSFQRLDFSILTVLEALCMVLCLRTYMYFKHRRSTFIKYLLLPSAVVNATTLCGGYYSCHPHFTGRS